MQTRFELDRSLLVTNVGYNVFEISAGGDRQYVHFYPSLIGKGDDRCTTPFATSNLPSSYLPSMDTIKNFWSSGEQFQIDGRYKGGEYGSNNLPSTNKNWTSYSGITPSIGTQITIISTTNGIVERKKFNSKSREQEILPNSESTCQTIEFKFDDGDIFIGYLLDTPTKQYATDTIVVYIPNGIRTVSEAYVRIAVRGKSHPNVDMPGKLICSAGETTENSTMTLKQSVKSAIAQELQIELSEAEIIELGRMDQEDPRYQRFSVIEDGEVKFFGFDRGSETELYLVIFRGEKPATVMDEFDKDEISTVSWAKMSDVLNIPDIDYMIPKHGEMFRQAYDYIQRISY